LALGFGKEEKLDRNVIRENVAKTIRKCIELKAKTVAFDISTTQIFGISAIIGANIANYHFDKYKTKKGTPN
jgi:leucyl aminopeptidase